MAEEQKEPQGEAAQVQQVTKEPQQVTQVAKELQRVTTKNLKKVEAGTRLAVHNHRRREEQRKKTREIGKDCQWSKPILRNWGCYNSGSYRWSWLLHLSKQERRSTK